VNGLANILAEILARIRIRFADVRLRREVDDVGDAVLVDDFLDQLAVLNIAFIEGTEFDGPSVPCAEVVENDGLAPGLGQQFTSVTSDITGAAGNQDRTRQATDTINVILR